MTLYRLFPSKDDLVVAALERRHEPTIAFISSLAEAPEASPRERLVGLFDRLEDEFGREAFHGCAFANAVLELHDMSHPARLVAEPHKRETADVIEVLARDAGARDPRDLAQQLVILLDGVMVAAQVRGDSTVARTAARAARSLAAAHLAERTT